MTGLIDCTAAGWRPGIGDPTWQGWSTTVMYIVVAVVAVFTAQRAMFPADSKRRERRFWLTIAVILGLLAINKQLDLQSALTQAGRCMAHAQGWYDQRQGVQIAFLGMLATVAVMFLFSLLVMMRGTLARTALPAIGLAFVLGFVMLRAVGFHYMDRALGHPVMGVRMNMILEWIGPMLILTAAIAALRSKSQRKRPTPVSTVRVAPLGE